MKSILEEYGKIIILVLSIFTVLGFLLGTGEKDFFGLIRKFKPEATIGTENNVDILEDYSKRLEPVLEVKTRKLTAGNPEDLLSFVTEIKGRVKVTADDGTESVETVDLEEENYELRIIKIVDQDKNEMPLLDPEPIDGTYLYTFFRLPDMPEDKEDMMYIDSYQVTYELTDKTIADFPIKTTKTYQFVVN